MMCWVGLEKAVVWTLLCGAVGCGTKTGLLVERCEDAGTRACSTACGRGTQLCGADGYWDACEPDVVEMPCEDACGPGLRVCTAEGFGECVVTEVERRCVVPCGEGVERCVDGVWGPCRAPGPLPPVVNATVRDFHDTHPDFERMRIGSDRGIVESLLGPDDKPVYAGDTPTTSGAANFDQWYRDVPGVNLGEPLDLRLLPETPMASTFVFDDPMFFPIDGRLFGNEGRMHNFHFTVEAVTSFIYEGGETFRFRGDDDVFVFIDRRLVIDLGGVHSAEEATVDVDDLGLEVGGRYPLHVFFAERHTTLSSFRIETTLSDPVLRCE